MVRVRSVGLSPLHHVGGRDRFSSLHCGGGQFGEGGGRVECRGRWCH